MATANSSIAAIFAAVAGNFLNKDSVNVASAIGHEKTENNKKSYDGDQAAVTAAIQQCKESNDVNQSFTEKEKSEFSTKVQTSTPDKLDFKEIIIKKEIDEDMKQQKKNISFVLDENDKSNSETNSSTERNTDQSDEELKAKLNSIMDLAAKFCERNPLSLNSTSSLSTTATTTVAATESKMKATSDLIQSNSDNSNPVPNSFFYPNFNSNSVAASKNYQIHEAAIKVLTSNSKLTDNNSKRLDLPLNKIESGSNSNGGGTDIDPNNYIMDLSSSSNLINSSSLILNTTNTESHIVPVDPNAIANLNSIDSNPIPPTKRRKRSNWNVETEKAFVKYWRQYYTELKKSKRTSVVYQKIADELNKFGLSLTCRDVQVKTHNMTQKYRHERRLIFQSDGKPSSWPVYDEVHDLIGHLYKDDAKPETSKDETIQSNGCLPGPPSPKTLKLEPGISQLDALGPLGQFGALSQFAPLGQFAPFNQLGALGAYDNIQIKKEEEEEYVMDNDINQPSVQDNLTTPSDYASESPSPSPISNNAANTSGNGGGSSANSTFTTIAGTGIKETTTVTNGKDGVAAESIGTSKKTKKRNFNVEILTEIKKLNKDAREDSQCSNKLLAEANQIEKKKLSIIEEYVRRSLQIQEKMLEIQIQRRNLI